nr:hypothetical protein [Tanacetum cinerariifolium]
GHSHKQIEDQGYFDSGCFWDMTGNISYLTDFKEFDEGYVAFGGGAKGDYLGKFDEKLDEGFFVGYFTNSKAFRVYNTRTRKVEENLHIKFLENKPLIASDGPKWLFDIDTLIESMNYVPVIAGTTFNDFAGKGASFDVGQSSMETRPSQDYILMPLWNDNSLFDSSLKALDCDNQDNNSLNTKSEIDNQERPNVEHSTKDINTIAPSINTMDIKSAFLYGRIEEEKSDRIFTSQDKYVDDILRKFKCEDVKPANTPMDKEKALLKDSDGDDVDVHLYRFMIGSLMYLTSSRPDIMFVVCTCAKF